MDRVRIGCVKYLNTLPLIQGLGSWRDCVLITAVPARLIDMLRRGDVDIALASIVDAASAGCRGLEALRKATPNGVVSPDAPRVAFAESQATAPGATNVVLLPVGMIGCDGPTLTVRVFSRIPIEQVRRVAVDTDSHTSVALLRVLMFKKFGVKIDIVDFDAREHMVIGGAAPAQAGHWPESVLLIGDKVVTDAPPAADYPHQMDLGAAWKELTGLPFVYATWMCRAGEEGSLKVRAAAMMLQRARLHNRTRMDWLVATHAEPRGWPHDLGAQYLGSHLKFDVQEPERQAVEKFLRWAVELGLVANGEVVWADRGVAQSAEHMAPTSGSSMS